MHGSHHLAGEFADVAQDVVESFFFLRERLELPDDGGTDDYAVGQAASSSTCSGLLMPNPTASGRDVLVVGL